MVYSTIITTVLSMVLSVSYPQIDHPYYNSHMYAQGSGFFIDGQGDIATAAHVVDGQKKVLVRYHNEMVKATVVEIDKANDTAIIHIDTKKLTPYFSLTDPKDETLGYIAGFPAATIFGVFIHYTSGEIILNAPDFGVYSIYGKACHGNSGGPILNSSGNAIGILVYGYQDETTADKLCSYHSGARFLSPLIKMAYRHNLPISYHYFPSITFKRMGEIENEINKTDAIVLILVEL